MKETSSTPRSRSRLRRAFNELLGGIAIHPGSTFEAEMRELAEAIDEADARNASSERGNLSLDRVIEECASWDDAYHAFRDLAVWGKTDYKPISDADRELALSVYRRAQRGDTPSASGRWIACSEREPREDDYPVVCLDSEGQPFTASSHASLTCYNASYWMPLPERPADEDGDWKSRPDGGPA